MADSSTSTVGGEVRLAFGCVVLFYLVVYNEQAASCIIFATIIAAIYCSFTARFDSKQRSLHIPYIRASHKIDFTFLFLSTWMEVLAILCSCVILARTLSMCCDVMTGGLARVSILGRNAQENEPWPDVLGVFIIFLVTLMCMLGLERSKTFRAIMLFGVCGLTFILAIITWCYGNSKQLLEHLAVTSGLKHILNSSALLCFVFSRDFGKCSFRPINKCLLALCSKCLCIFIVICLSSLVKNNASKEYVAVPLFALLIENHNDKLIPAAACLLMLSASGAFIELFSDMYGSIVKLASSDWKILSKQIRYESAGSGNPVLAIFIAGSLCAMLVFSCPLQNLCYMLAASHLAADFFQIFYFLYTPFRPTFIEQTSTVESTLSYSRLSTTLSNTSSKQERSSKWNWSFQKRQNWKIPARKVNKKTELEKEWLLLGEPTSPCSTNKDQTVECTKLTNFEPVHCDIDCTDKSINSESDSSTDIDAIVDEYRQKIKITAVGHADHSVPSLISWKLSIATIFFVIIGIVFTITSLFLDWHYAMIAGCIIVFIVSVLMNALPKLPPDDKHLNPVISCNVLFINLILNYICVQNAWIAILSWSLGGLVLLLRCDQWCCNCFEEPSLLDHEHNANVSTGKSTTIRIPRPPKVILTIPAHHSGLS